MTIRCSYIPYQETGKFSPLVCGYLNKDPFLEPFFHQFPTKENFAAFISAKHTHPVDREMLFTVLKNQYEQTGLLDGKMLERLENLRLSNTFTVTTGQQIGILLGPLYATLKIISAIKLSRQLKEGYPEFNFVPVFWMATEDHDVEEIRHVYVNGKKLSWETNQTGPVGRFNNGGMEEVLRQYRDIAGNAPDTLWLNDVLTTAYALPTLSDATRYIVHTLFGDEGVVCIDADDSRFKKSFIPVITKDIIEQVSYSAVEKSRNALEKKYHSQVNGREINFFYLQDTYRDRIVSQDEGFATSDGKFQWNLTDLKLEIETHPERFSPNVLMRPLFQETILPNIAYIGGGAEVAYWLELKGIFDEYQVPFPALMLRNSAIVIDQVNSHRFHKSGLALKDLFADVHSLEKKMALAHSNEDLLLINGQSLIEQLQNQLLEISAATDATLEDAATALSVKFKQELERFSKKLLRAEKRKSGEEIRRLHQLMEHIYPGGSLQERKESLPGLILTHGRALLIDLQENIDPLNNQFAVLYY